MKNRDENARDIHFAAETENAGKNEERVRKVKRVLKSIAKEIVNGLLVALTLVGRCLCPHESAFVPYDPAKDEHLRADRRLR